jgi:hypothetical protein
MNNRITCAIHQPNLFPRLSTLAKLAQADVWVVLDDVQFNARDYQHRARLAALDDISRQQWLTVPVHRPQGRDTLIRDLQLAEPTKSHRRVHQLIRQHYGRSQHWQDARLVVDEVAAALLTTTRLVNIAELSTRTLLSQLGWHGKVVYSSTLPVRTGRSERLADLTAAVGAAEYLCGTGGARYLDERPFADLGLHVCYVSRPLTEARGAARRVSALWDFATRGMAAVREEITAR